MSIYLPTDESKISNAFLAVVGAYPGYTYMNAAKSYGLVPTMQALIDYSGLTTAPALASRVASNLGLTGTALTDGTAYLTTVTFGGASSSWASNLVSTLNLFATLTNNAVYGTAASAHVSRINAAVTYSANSSNTSTNVTTLAAAAGSPGTTQESTGSTFTLTTNVDGITGTAGNDTISGLAGVSGTFNVGDVIDGGAGTDTLNLNVQSGGQSQLVTISNVENINARLLEAGPGSALALNAIDWTGVSVLSFNNSLDETAIRVSGLTTGPSIRVQNEVDANIDFRGLTSGTDSVSLILTTAGSGGGTAASLTSAGVADIDLDLDNSGMLDTLNLTLIGTNYAVLEGGADLRSINVSGAGGAYLSTDDEITSFQASGVGGALDVIFSGRSDVAVVGGAGNDTFRFVTGGLNSYDSVDGGAGTDSLVFTLAGSTVKPVTTSVERATATLSAAGGGTIDASAAASITSYDIKATAGATGAITNLGGGVTLKLSDTNLDDLAVDLNTAASITITIGSAGTATSVGEITITDASSVSIAPVATFTAEGSGGNTIDLIDMTDTDIKDVTISANSTGEADLTITKLVAAGVTTLVLNSNGSGALSIQNEGSAGNAFSGASAITTVTVNASGTAADMGVTAMFGSAKSLSTFTVNSTAGADVTLGKINLGASTAQNTMTFNVNAGATSDVLVSGIDSTGLNVTLNLSAGADGDILMGSANVAVAGSGSAAVLTINASVGSGTIEVSGIDLSGGSANLTFGTLVAGQSGVIDLGSAGGIVFAAGGNVGTGRVSDLAMTLGTAASGAIGAISMSASGTMGAINISLASGANVVLGARGAEDQAASQGAITITGQGSQGASANTVTVGNISAKSIGDITLAQRGTGTYTFSGLAATGGSIGSIDIQVATGASVTMGTGTLATGSTTASFFASAVGNITVSGAGTVAIAGISATTVGDVDTTRMTTGGSFTINLAGVTQAVNVYAGAGTNTIKSGVGDDVIRLTSGLGTDTIIYSSGNLGNDRIERFEAGTTRDKIAFGTGLAAAVMVGSALATDATNVKIVTAAADGAVDMGSSLASFLLIQATAFASTARMASAIASGGSLEVGAGGGESTAGSIVVVWTDGTDSYVTLVATTAGLSGTDSIIASTPNATNMATLAGINLTNTAITLVSGNFDFL